MNKREKGLANMVAEAKLELVGIENKHARYIATAKAPNGKVATFWVTATSSGDPRAEQNELSRMKRFCRDNPAKKEPAAGVPSTLPSPVAETRREFAPRQPRTVILTRKPAEAPKPNAEAPAQPPAQEPIAVLQPPAPAPASQPNPNIMATIPAPSNEATKPKPAAKLDRKQFYKLGAWAEDAAQLKGKTLADLCAIASAALGFNVPQQAMTEALDLHDLKGVIAKPVKRTPNAVLADTLAALLLKLGDKVPEELAALTSKASAEVAA